MNRPSAGSIWMSSSASTNERPAAEPEAADRQRAEEGERRWQRATATRVTASEIAERANEAGSARTVAKLSNEPPNGRKVGVVDCSVHVRQAATS